MRRVVSACYDVWCRVSLVPVALGETHFLLLLVYRVEWYTSGVHELCGALSLCVKLLGMSTRGDGSWQKL